MAMVLGHGMSGLRFCEWKKETIKKFDRWSKAMKLETKRSAPVQSFRWFLKPCRACCTTFFWIGLQARGAKAGKPSEIPRPCHTRLSRLSSELSRKICTPGPTAEATAKTLGSRAYTGCWPAGQARIILRWTHRISPEIDTEVLVCILISV